MWPWSTLRRLRTENTRLNDRWQRVNEAYEVLDGKYQAAIKEVDRAHREVASLRFAQTELDHANGVILDLQGKLREVKIEAEELRSRIIDTGAMRAENESLKARLAEASKNDKRGPNGRFVKASS